MIEKNASKFPNEEFSVEFGDVNGVKLYEIPYMSQKNHKKITAKKEK